MKLSSTQNCCLKPWSLLLGVEKGVVYLFMHKVDVALLRGATFSWDAFHVLVGSVGSWYCNYFSASCSHYCWSWLVFEKFWHLSNVVRHQFCVAETKVCCIRLFFCISCFSSSKVGSQRFSAVSRCISGLVLETSLQLWNLHYYFIKELQPD